MAREATPITTAQDIDEAIWWVLMTAPRNIDHMKIIDALLDQRIALTDPAAPEPPHHRANPAAHPEARQDQTADHPTSR